MLRRGFLNLCRGGRATRAAPSRTLPALAARATVRATVRVTALVAVLAVPAGTARTAPGLPSSPALAVPRARPAGGAKAAAWEVTDVSFRAAERGLDALTLLQQDDGSWLGDVGYKLNTGFEVIHPQVPHVGVTALAGLAFLAGGHMPGEGPYGSVVEGALRFVLSTMEEEGYLSANGTRMYSHAFATLFLAEVHGMEPSERTGEPLQRAIDLVVRSQNRHGGWRYQPFQEDSDLSVTVCQVMALRAANNIGIRVPRSTIDRATQYVRASRVREDVAFPPLPGGYPFGNERGSFRYQDQMGARTSFALTAAGVTTLYGAGIYADEDLRLGLDYLLRNQSALSRIFLAQSHYFYYYGHYYAAQAMFLAGGRYWEEYYPRLRDELVRSQRADGTWPNDVGPGPPFATAVATLLLELPYRYLPILQR